MDPRLDDKVALVSGGFSAVARDFAGMLAEAGAAVALAPARGRATAARGRGDC